MTDETKNLFDAPWYVFSSPDDEITVIENESGRVLAELDDVKTANRLARLPELYDALVEAARFRCWHCRHEDFPDFACIEDFERNCKTASCGCREWWKLLKKVRDGE